MYFYFVIFLQFFTFICAELFCDIQRYVDPQSSRQILIYTIANYSIPPWRGNLYQPNVSCPLDEDGNLCPRKCCLPGDSFSHDKKCLISDLSTEVIVSEIRKTLTDANSSSISSTASSLCVIYGSYCSSVIEPIDLSALPSKEDYCLDFFSDTKNYEMARCITATNYIDSVLPIYTICLGLSILFLFLTFMIYFSIQNLRNLPGKILLAYVASLLITDIFYVMLQVMLVTEGTICVCSGKA